MLRNILATLTFGIVTVAAGHASSLAPGGTVSATSIAYPGGTLELFTGDSLVSGTAFMATYSLAIISDPANALCAGCLDFVYQPVNNPASKDSLVSFSTGSFKGGVLTDVFYATGGEIAPSTISRSADGSTITFNYDGTPVGPNENSDFLIIETNAAPFSYSAGFSTITGTSDATATGIGASVSTPEPASFVLLGSGLLGLAGMAKRKFLKA
jgi:hypothetical protein